MMAVWSPKGAAPPADFNARARRRSDAKRTFSTLHFALPAFPGPFLLQNVNEQARGRHTDSTLPRCNGTATKKANYFQQDPASSAETDDFWRSKFACRFRFAGYL